MVRRSSLTSSLQPSFSGNSLTTVNNSPKRPPYPHLHASGCYSSCSGGISTQSPPLDAVGAAGGGPAFCRGLFLQLSPAIKAEVVVPSSSSQSSSLLQSHSPESLLPSSVTAKESLEAAAKYFATAKSIPACLTAASEDMKVKKINLPVGASERTGGNTIHRSNSSSSSAADGDSTGSNSMIDNGGGKSLDVDVFSPTSVDVQSTSSGSSEDGLRRQKFSYESLQEVSLLHPHGRSREPPSSSFLAQKDGADAVEDGGSDSSSEKSKSTKHLELESLQNATGRVDEMTTTSSSSVLEVWRSGNWNQRSPSTTTSIPTTTATATTPYTTTPEATNAAGAPEENCCTQDHLLLMIKAEVTEGSCEGLKYEGKVCEGLPSNGNPTSNTSYSGEMSSLPPLSSVTCIEGSSGTNRSSGNCNRQRPLRNRKRKRGGGKGHDRSNFSKINSAVSRLERCEAWNPIDDSVTAIESALKCKKPEDVVGVEKLTWYEGFRQPLGADGRQVLLRKLRKVYHQDPMQWDDMLANYDILFSRMPYATVTDLFKLSYLLGVFDFALKCSAEYGGDPGSSRGPKKRRKSSGHSAITMNSMKADLDSMDDVASRTPSPPFIRSHFSTCPSTASYSSSSPLAAVNLGMSVRSRRHSVHSTTTGTNGRGRAHSFMRYSSASKSHLLKSTQHHHVSSSSVSASPLSSSSLASPPSEWSLLPNDSHRICRESRCVEGCPTMHRNNGSANDDDFFGKTTRRSTSLPGDSQRGYYTENSVGLDNFPTRRSSTATTSSSSSLSASSPLRTSISSSEGKKETTKSSWQISTTSLSPLSSASLVLATSEMKTTPAGAPAFVGPSTSRFNGTNGSSGRSSFFSSSPTQHNNNYNNGVSSSSSSRRWSIRHFLKDDDPEKEFIAFMKEFSTRVENNAAAAAAQQLLQRSAFLEKRPLEEREESLSSFSSDCDAPDGTKSHHPTNNVTVTSVNNISSYVEVKSDSCSSSDGPLWLSPRCLQTGTTGKAEGKREGGFEEAGKSRDDNLEDPLPEQHQQQRSNTDISNNHSSESGRGNCRLYDDDVRPVATACKEKETQTMLSASRDVHLVSINHRLQNLSAQYTLTSQYLQIVQLLTMQQKLIKIMKTHSNAGKMAPAMASSRRPTEPTKACHESADATPTTSSLFEVEELEKLKFTALLSLSDRTKDEEETEKKQSRPSHEVTCRNV